MWDVSLRLYRRGSHGAQHAVYQIGYISDACRCRLLLGFEPLGAKALVCYQGKNIQCITEVGTKY